MVRSSLETRMDAEAGASPASPPCSPGTQLVGVDGNGCGGTCEPCSQILCSNGTQLVGDKNGCGGRCEPCFTPFCSPGTQPVGVDGNGCGGTCEPCSQILCSKGTQL